MLDDSHVLLFTNWRSMKIQFIIWETRAQTFTIRPLLDFFLESHSSSYEIIAVSMEASSVFNEHIFITNHMKKPEYQLGRINKIRHSIFGMFHVLE